MAKNAKELSQVKARQTKLGKKNSDELIQIILKKDKVERNLNNQIKSLKGEVNALSTRVNNFDKDMEGTLQTLETYKDRCHTLQEEKDVINLELKDTHFIYEEENKKAITLANKFNMLKIVTYIMAAITLIAVSIAVL